MFLFRAAEAGRHHGCRDSRPLLEIAIFYANQGRTEQVKTLARHMAPIFQAHAIHREALAALTLFRQAAERERVTAELARDMLSYLHKARYDPELRFEAG